ncbi:MAG TPA: hypothetical protein VJZ17_00775 [Nitrosopumilaceae archaeon]|nr:hypothetical protein [Nitrosopumilaceae archaeon]
MFHPKKFIRKTTKFERRIKKAPDMAEIRENTTNLQERPEKYLNSALEKLGIPENLKNQIKQMFENLRLRNAGWSGFGDPMPDLAGLIYFVCKQNFLWLKRETVADALGINKEMVTKGHKIIRSQLVTESLRDNNSNTKWSYQTRY